MTILDDQNQMQTLDKSNVLGSIEHLPQQIEHAWQDANKVNVPDDYKNINRIVMTGMGGSGLGARVIEAVYGLELKIPLVRINDYDLPNWVDQNTLVICSSFSGTTEEVIENAKQAQQKNTKWMAIATGGTLIDMAKQANVPYYQIEPTHNPSKQPRMALGYTVIGQLVMASKVGIFHLNHEESDNLITSMNSIIGQNQASIPTENNPAKQIAQKLENKIVLFVTSRHLVGSVHTVKNQMNENAKHVSAIFTIPELNHHLMEGLAHPNSNHQTIEIYFIESDLFPEKIRQRTSITQDIVKQNNISYSTWHPSSSNKLSQAFEFLQFGSYINFYLSMLHNLDPAPIPWVDEFKKQLGQPLGQFKQ